MIKVQKVTSEDTYPIRLEVLRKNIPLPYMFNGDFDKETFHLGAFKNNKLIAVSSFMKASNNNFRGNQFQLRGMATLEGVQGLGAGKLMVTKAIDILKTKHIDCLWCNARVAAVDFYKKQGFNIIGELFDIKYVGPHYLMFNELK